MKSSALPVNPAYPATLVTLGDHIRKRRLDLGIKQKELATIINVTKETIWNWENNRIIPRIQYYPKIMNFLGYCSYVYPTTWGEKLKLHRIHNGFSYKNLANILSVDPASIRRWEKRKKPPWERCRRIIETFFDF
tara:strand:- start:158 stop:562 length:405 start_codon:yes stop_codon:yes gene_type:complete